MFTRATVAIRRWWKRRKPLAIVPTIAGHQMIFICGLHRSGTSILHRVLRESPEVSGLTDTGVPEDEGQHVQSVFKPALAFGGPGQFAFDPASHLTEADAADPARDRATLLREWGSYLDLSKRFFIEKSPPNLVRTRYLQALFPEAKFVFIVRHPAVVALATEKWTGTTHLEMMLHWQAAHLTMLEDLPHLAHSLVLRYEDMADAFEQHLGMVCDFLGIAPFQTREILSDQNSKYFATWEKNRRVDDRLLARMMAGGPMAEFGYTFSAPWRQPRTTDAAIRPRG